MQEVRETVYEHLSGGETFTITAAERWSVTMLRHLKEKYPEQVEIAHENKNGSLLARVPFEWMRIVPKRRDTMSDEQRAAQSERMKAQKLKWDTEKSGQIRTVAAPKGNYICSRTESVLAASSPWAPYTIVERLTFMGGKGTSHGSVRAPKSMCKRE